MIVSDASKTGGLRHVLGAPLVAITLSLGAALAPARAMAQAVYLAE